MKLHCGHAFHRLCILEWLAANNQECYLCKEVDPFLDTQDIINNVDENSLIEKMLNKLEGSQK